MLEGAELDIALHYSTSVVVDGKLVCIGGYLVGEGFGECLLESLGLTTAQIVISSLFCLF